LEFDDGFFADEEKCHAVIGANLMEMVNDFGDKVLEHEHDTVTFFEHNYLKLKDLLFLFLFFLILTFEQFQIGLFVEFIFVHFFYVLSGSDKVIFFRINVFFLCRNLIFHVVIFVLDEFVF
jgi:hypothetical protein